MVDVQSLTWPIARLGEAIDVLAQRAGFATAAPLDSEPALGSESCNPQALERWIAMATRRLGLEAEAVSALYSEIEQLVRNASPALLQLPGGQAPRFLALLKSGPWRVSVISPSLTVHRVRPALLRDALTQQHEAPWLAELDRLLVATKVPRQRQAHVRRALLEEQLSGVQINAGWLLRLSPGASLWRQIRHARLTRHGMMLIAAHGIHQGLLILGWWLIMQGALLGHFDRAWLWAWGLVLLTSIPFQVLALWMQTLLTLGLGCLFRQRLLFGALQLPWQTVRQQGTGQFLSRVMESQAIETLLLSGGFAAVTAVVELIMALVILAHGVTGWLHVSILGLWVILTLLYGWRYLVRNRDWRRSHRHMLHTLVERMIGYRTRLAQEHPHQWHTEEDRLLAGHGKLSRRLDSTEAHLTTVVGRGWLLLGLMGISYTLLTSTSTEPLLIAISLGGIMLAYKALTSLTEGMQSVAAVVNAQEQIAPLFEAATDAQRVRKAAPATVTATATPKSANNEPQLVARDLYFRYRDFGEPVLRQCSLQIRSGQRVLLSGPSGSGKSTLSAILAGLRPPASGLLLWQGLDQATLGYQTWRRQIVASPQFHENHVLVETFAFNLLMGRNWPPSEEDLADAEAVCRTLGLGELLDRMPAGLQQMVGESGWQLSHGERSRLYIARALLQQAEIIILDESFGALDPENLQRVLSCVLAQTPTLLVIGHS